MSEDYLDRLFPSTAETEEPTGGGSGSVTDDSGDDYAQRLFGDGFDDSVAPVEQVEPEAAPLDKVQQTEIEQQAFLENPDHDTWYERLGARLAKNAFNIGSAIDNTMGGFHNDSVNFVKEQQRIHNLPDDHPYVVENLAKHEGRRDESLKGLAHKQIAADLIEVAPVVNNALAESNTLWDAIKIAGVDPIGFMAELSATNALEGAATVGAVALGGPAIAAGVAGMTSGTSAYNQDLINSLKEAGVDTKNPQSMIDAFNDPELMAAIKGESTRYAVGIGMVDAVSGGLASKLLVKKPIYNFLTQTAVQTSLEGVGEAVGTVAAGREVDSKEIFAEMAGGFGPTAVAESAAGTRNAFATNNLIPDAAKDNVPVTDLDGNPVDTAIPDEITNREIPEADANPFDEVVGDVDDSEVAANEPVDDDANLAAELDEELGPDEDAELETDIEDEIDGDLDQLDDAEYSPDDDIVGLDELEPNPDSDANADEDVAEAQAEAQPTQEGEVNEDEPQTRQGRREKFGEPQGSEQGSPRSETPIDDGRNNSEQIDESEGASRSHDDAGQVSAARSETSTDQQVKAVSKEGVKRVIKRLASTPEQETKLSVIYNRLDGEALGVQEVFSLAEQLTKDDISAFRFTDMTRKQRANLREVKELMADKGKLDSSPEETQIKKDFVKGVKKFYKNANFQVKSNKSLGPKGAVAAYGRIPDQFNTGKEFLNIPATNPTMDLVDMQHTLTHELIHRGQHVLEFAAAERGVNMASVYKEFVNSFGGVKEYTDYVAQKHPNGQLPQRGLTPFIAPSGLATEAMFTEAARGGDLRSSVWEMVAYNGMFDIDTQTRPIYNKIIDSVVDALRQVVGSEFVDTMIAKYGTPEMFLSTMARQSLAATAKMDGDFVTKVMDRNYNYDKALDKDTADAIETLQAGRSVARQGESRLVNNMFSGNDDFIIHQMGKPKEVSDGVSTWEYDGDWMKSKLHSVFKDFRFGFQNKFEELDHIHKMIMRQGNKISAQENLILNENIGMSKVANQLERMNQEDFESFRQALKDSGYTRDELDLYMMALHAEERNNKMFENFGIEDGSGMSTEIAGEVLAHYENTGMDTALEPAAQVIRDMYTKQRELMVDSGLIAESTIDGWNDDYENYVALKGFGVDPITGKPYESETPLVLNTNRTGKGIKGAPVVFKSKGRKTRADSPSAYAFLDYTNTIIQADKNNSRKAFLRLVKKNPNPKQWKIFSDKKPKYEYKDVTRTDPDGTKRLERVKRKVNMRANSSKFLEVNIKGQSYYIEVKNQRLMEQLLSLGVQKSNAYIKYGSKYIRLMSALNTKWNLEFAPKNFARDMQTAMAFLSSEKTNKDSPLSDIDTRGIEGRVMRNAHKAAASYVRSRTGVAIRPGNKMDLAAHRFVEAGAPTGYYDNLDIDAMKDRIDKLTTRDPSKMDKLTDGLRAVDEWVDIYNGGFENAIRLSTFNELTTPDSKGQALSDDDAAFFVKNLSVNFNTRGANTGYLQATYMFFNASVQGTANLSKALVRNPFISDADGDGKKFQLTGAQKFAAASIVAGYTLAAMNREMMGEDDDGVDKWDRAPHYLKERNFMMANPVYDTEDPESKEYVTFPAAYGYNVFLTMGYGLENIVNKGTEGVGDSMSLMLSTAVGSFSPIGWRDSKTPVNALVKNVAPEIAQIPLGLGFNDNDFADSIVYENSFDNDPSSSRGRPSTVQSVIPYDEFANFVNSATGGAEEVSGELSLHPDQIRYVLEKIGGGAGRLATDTVESLAALSPDIDVNPNRIPFANTFMADVDTRYQMREDYYKNQKRFSQLEDQQELIDAGLSDMTQEEFDEKFGDEANLIDDYKATKKALRKEITKFRREIYEDDDMTQSEKKAALENLMEEEVAIIKDFNRDAREAKK